jgi:hypothetical protein
MEALKAYRRDRAEKGALIFKQIEERQALQRDIQAQRAMAQLELLRLREDAVRYQSLDREGHDRRPVRTRGDEEGGVQERMREQRPRRRRGPQP